jgi:V8-like Glu-specific endopeptidase
MNIRAVVRNIRVSPSWQKINRQLLHLETLESREVPSTLPWLGQAIEFDIEKTTSRLVPPQPFFPSGAEHLRIDGSQMSATENTSTDQALVEPQNDGMRWIYGPDDRVRVTPTTSFPWRAVGRVQYMTPQGGMMCSGAMVSAFHFLTAAHCVHPGQPGAPWFTNFIVTPGRDGSALQPYGEARATYLRTYVGWTNGGDSQFDFALITLDRRIGDTTGWLGYEFNNNDSYFTGLNANSAGYPGDLPASPPTERTYQMYRMSGPYSFATTHEVFWNGTLDAMGGQSGSPMWRYDGTNRYINSVLSHGTFDQRYNVSTRITEQKFNDLKKWISEDQSPPSVPSAPASLVATALNASSISLLWTDVSTETGYKIERSLSSSGGWMQISTTGANSTVFTDTGLASGTTYYYRVRAFNAVGDGGYSPIASDRTSDLPSVPSAPASLVATALNASSISLLWTDVSTETGYKIERSLSSSGGWVQISTTGANSTVFTDTGLASGTTYYYRVRAFNAVGDGVYSPIASDRTPEGGITPLPPFFAVGGAPGLVQLRSEKTGTVLFTFAPFGLGYTGEVTVARGDVDNDGHPDLVVAARNGNPHVKVYSGRKLAETFDPSPALMASFFPFAQQYNVGSNVAVADVNGDGWDDLVTGATVGNPHVRIFSGKGLAGGATESAVVSQFFAYGLQFNVGANVSAGDFDKDGFAEVVTAATAGNPHVKIYDGESLTSFGGFPEFALRAQFFPYAVQFNVGAYVSIGDTNGDGFVDLISGATVGSPHVKVYDGQAIAGDGIPDWSAESALLSHFFAYGPWYQGGVRVGAFDFDGDGRAEILTGTAHTTPHVRIVSGGASGVQPTAMFEDMLFSFNGGIFVGG